MSDIADYIKQNETSGRFFPKPYKDTKGKRTIGSGFNIDDPTVAQHLPPDVLAGTRDLQPIEDRAILNVLVNRAKSDVKSLYGEATFNQLAPHRRMALIDMAYNMGRDKLGGFVEMKKAIDKRDFGRAAAEILNSKYASHVGQRALDNAQLMRGQ
jgi:lysozyme